MKSSINNETAELIKKSYAKKGVLAQVALEFGISCSTARRIIKPEDVKKENERRNERLKKEKHNPVDCGKRRKCLCCPRYFHKTHKYNFVCPICTTRMKESKL